jgi:hypothetical protein
MEYDYLIPCVESHNILEVISPVWKPSNKSISRLIPEYIGFKIMEQRTVSYMPLCFEEVVAFSISVCFFPKALDAGGLKSVHNLMFLLFQTNIILHHMYVYIYL